MPQQEGIAHRKEAGGAMSEDARQGTISGGVFILRFDRFFQFPNSFLELLLVHQDAPKIEVCLPIVGFVFDGSSVLRLGLQQRALSLGGTELPPAAGHWTGEHRPYSCRRGEDVLRLGYPGRASDALKRAHSGQVRSSEKARTPC